MNTFESGRALVMSAAQIYTDYDAEVEAARQRAESRLAALGLSIGLSATLAEVPAAPALPSLPAAPVTTAPGATEVVTAARYSDGTVVESSTPGEIDPPVHPMEDEAPTAPVQATAEPVAPKPRRTRQTTPKPVKEKTPCIGVDGEGCPELCTGERCLRCNMKYVRRQSHGGKRAGDLAAKEGLGVAIASFPDGNGEAGTEAGEERTKVQEAVETTEEVPVSLSLSAVDILASSPVVSEFANSETPKAAPVSIPVASDLPDGVPVISDPPYKLTPKQTQHDLPAIRSKGMNNRRAQEQGWFHIAYVDDGKYLSLAVIVTPEIDANPEYVTAQFVETCHVRNGLWWSGTKAFGRFQPHPATAAKIAERNGVAV